MKFAIITHVAHGQEDNNFYAYAPYIKEMNIWAKHVTEIFVVAPHTLKEKSAIDTFLIHDKVVFNAIKPFNLISFGAILKALLIIPTVVFQIFKTIKSADHIHLRCPGNIGLLACIIQIFFPNKIKTAKYAGNWDPDAKQPLSYKIQKWILSNTFLTKNIQVLVYGEWIDQSNNIKPFFTASYDDLEKKDFVKKEISKTIKFLFVGTLTSGKRPLYAIRLIEKLSKIRPNIVLELYGEGQEKLLLQDYITTNKLNEFIFLKGNKHQNIIKQAYIDSHFVILPSKSEGWPKAIAEGMFWGCLPVATNVSCILNMLDNQNRGIILDLDLENDSKKIIDLLHDKNLYQNKVEKAVKWSRKYTTNYFEKEIMQLLVKK